MIENTAPGIITTIGLLLVVIGLIFLYLAVWGFLYKMIIAEIDDWQYTHAIVLGAVLVMYTGAGIAVIGLVI